jgi:CheY-like chemotaxis protein
MRILVVDNNPSYVNLLAWVLAVHKHAVSKAVDGDEALRCLGREGIDVIIADVGMRGMSGKDVHRFIRQSPLFRNLPFVWLSGSGEMREVLDVEKSGLDFFVDKTMCIPELVTLMDHISSKGKEEPEATQSLAAPSEGSTLHSPLHPRLAWMMLYERTGSTQEVSSRFGISRKTFYKWLKRYRDSKGDSSSLLDHSRRPLHHPTAVPPEKISLILLAKRETGYGCERLRVHLHQHYGIKVSVRTIWRILKKHETPPPQTRVV